MLPHRKQNELAWTLALMVFSCHLGGEKGKFLTRCLFMFHYCSMLYVISAMLLLYLLEVLIFEKGSSNTTCWRCKSCLNRRKNLEAGRRSWEHTISPPFLMSFQIWRLQSNLLLKLISKWIANPGKDCCMCSVSWLYFYFLYIMLFLEPDYLIMCCFIQNEGRKSDEDGS